MPGSICFIVLVSESCSPSNLRCPIWMTVLFLFELNSDSKAVDAERKSASSVLYKPALSCFHSYESAIERNNLPR